MSTAVVDSAKWGISQGPPKPGAVRVGIIDMNAGHTNEAIRCIRRLVQQFADRVTAVNPGLEVEPIRVSPRDTDDRIPSDCHFYVSSGGPGSPFDGDGKQWVDDYSSFLDSIVDENVAKIGRGRSIFCVCYSFEMAVRHFKIAKVVPRTTRKFGVMPIYTTEEGRTHPLLSPFGDRLFAFEHRNWEAVDLDFAKLKSTDGKLLARESRDGVSKGQALLAIDFAPGVEGVQFHPEADRPGVTSWVERPDQAEAFKLAYGITTYDRMIRTLDNPERLARTFALLIPGWITRKFNALAEGFGWNPLPPPTQSMESFGSLVPTAPVDRPSARLKKRPPNS
ncbi:MAG: hypothetical protein NVS3B20_05310 [Polyangiales bacterium]